MTSRGCWRWEGWRLHQRRPDHTFRHPWGAAQPAITRDPVTDALKASQLLGVDVDHVAGPGPLVPAHRLGWLQVIEPAEAQALEHSAHGGERCRQDSGHSPESAALMTEVDGALELLCIERPPPAAANTASIHQSRGTA